jgi:hypothetical protein
MANTTNLLPIEPWDTTESIHVRIELINKFRFRRSIQSAMLIVASDILGQKCSSHGPGWKHVVIAVVTTPFRKVIGNVKGSGRRCGIFIVNEMHVLHIVDGFSRFLGSRENDYIGAEQIAVCKYQLGFVSNLLFIVPGKGMILIPHFRQCLNQCRVLLQYVQAHSEERSFAYVVHLLSPEEPRSISVVPATG